MMILTQELLRIRVLHVTFLEFCMGLQVKRNCVEWKRYLSHCIPYARWVLEFGAFVIVEQALLRLYYNSNKTGK